MRTPPVAALAALLTLAPVPVLDASLPAALRPGPGTVSGQAVGSGPAAVPYVPQTELLCGGAALAMVQRAWGARGVQPGKWSALVRPAEGGIRTDDLARAAAGDGWDVRAGPLSGITDLESALAAGPVIALIGDRPGIFHYVVVLGVEGDIVRFHDPAVGPDRRTAVATFDGDWNAAGRWALMAVPVEGRLDAEPDAPPARADPSGPAALEASAHFRAGRWLDAARAAGEDAPRLRAASLYLAGRPGPALDAWAATGAARLDLVRVDGLHRIRHPVVHGYLGLTPEVPLTRDELERARRRLRALPALAGAGIGYRPVGAGERVEVHARVVERRTVDLSPMGVAVTTARAVAEERIRVGRVVGGTGAWLELDASFGGALRERAVRLSAPGVAGLPGVVTVEGRDSREAHVTGEEARRSLHLTLSDWLTGTLHYGIGLGLESWDGGSPGPWGSAGAGWRGLGDRLALGARGRAGDGPGGAWARIDLDVSARGGAHGDGVPALGWSVDLWAAAVGDSAPLTLRPGAGTGDTRERLLRAHPLERDGVITGPALAPRLAGSSAELVRWFEAPAASRVGAAVFVDAVVGPTTLVDAGLGVRVALPGAPGVLRLDGAMGLRDGATALSVGWMGPWPGGS